MDAIRFDRRLIYRLGFDGYIEHHMRDPAQPAKGTGAKPDQLSFEDGNRTGFRVLDPFFEDLCRSSQFRFPSLTACIEFAIIIGSCSMNGKSRMNLQRIGNSGSRCFVRARFHPGEYQR
jgi:hypothetical protein